MTTPRLVLCMIVKNEAAIIRRCLAAALPVVDGYVVCDTGSGDATLALVEAAAAEGGVPGRTCRHAWQDFGHNRTLAAEAARAWVQEQGWPLEATYLLFLDADMVLHAQPGFDKRQLRAASYHVAQDDGGLRYYNLRLACLAHGWRSVGVTHEYWQAEGGAAPPERLESLWIEDRGDGGSKAEKFERDARLLAAGLEREPDNARYMFYLGQTFFDLGRWPEALAWYRRRHAAGGWDEERWYARYREGLCLLHMGEPERAAGVLLEAFQERPSRAEPLHALARHYRERSCNQPALMLALRGLEVPYPAQDILFVARTVYEWELWEEIAISAFYCGSRYHEIGLAACERLLRRPGHPPAFYEHVARNRAFYVEAGRAPRAPG
jgi:tetratricopeptide (TPR) repeat protein